MSYYKMNHNVIEADLRLKISVLCRNVLELPNIDDSLRQEITELFACVNQAYVDALEWCDNSQFRQFISEMAGPKGKLVLDYNAHIAQFDKAPVKVAEIMQILSGESMVKVDSYDNELVDASDVAVDFTVGDDGTIENEEMSDLLAAAYALLISHMAEDLSNGGARIRMVTYWDAEEIDSEFSQLVRGFFGEEHPINDISIADALRLSLHNPSEHIFALFEQPITSLAYAMGKMEERAGLLVYEANGYTIGFDPETAILVTDHPSGDIYEAINFIEVVEDVEE